MDDSSLAGSIDIILGNICFCPCHCTNSNELHKEYNASDVVNVVDKTKTESYKRSKTSVNDVRLSIPIGILLFLISQKVFASNLKF